MGDIGDDQLLSQDGEVDDDVCGDGTDAVTGDVADRLDECEFLNDASIATPSPGPTPTPSPPAPVKPPAASPAPFQLSVVWPPRLQLSHIFRRGIQLTVNRGRSCSATGTLSVDRATARRLRLRSLPRRGAVILARGTAKTTGDGRIKMTLRLSATGKRAKLRAGTVKAALEVVAVAGTGPQARRTQRVTLRR